MGYPYNGPGWAPVQVCETRKGLGHFLKGMYLAIILMIISGLVMGVVFSDMPDIYDMQNEADLESMMGTLALLVVSGLVMAVAGIAAFIFFILGLMEMHRGKSEFGPGHGESVRLAIIFLILAIVISVISGAIAAAMVLGSIDFTSQDPPNAFGMEDTLSGTSAITGVVGIVSAIFQYLFLVYLVKELTGPEKRSVLWAGFGLGVASSVASLFITLMLLYGGWLDGSSSLQVALYTSLVPTFITLFALILFIVCFREILAMIDAGELKPIPPQMPYYPGYSPVPPQPPTWP